jgi:hypothetical protein
MQQFLLSVHVTDAEYDADAQDVDMEQIYKDVDAYNQQLREAGRWVFGGGLVEPSHASVVRPKDTGAVTTDGPFVETKEQIGGFWVIKATDKADAMSWAERAAFACHGPVEVRAFQDEPED